MALKINLTKQVHGQAVLFKDAYAIVMDVQVNKPYPKNEPNANPPGASRVGVQIYTDASKTHLIKAQHYFFDTDFGPYAKNPWAQAYAFLKSLPEFTDAVDC